jgi:hypothetical protein
METNENERERKISNRKSQIANLKSQKKMEHGFYGLWTTDYRLSEVSSAPDYARMSP